MDLNVVITGSSGMVGKGVLLECLDDERVGKVLIINRSSINLTHPKLTEWIVEDFQTIDGSEEILKGYKCCFFCAGVTSLGLSEEQYSKLTYDLTISFAEAFLKSNPNSTFCYVSGAGTDSSEKGRSMWARVKGRTENALRNMPFKASYMFRPGYIQPLKGIKSKTGWYQTLYNIFRPIYAILKHFPSTATSTTNMGMAMIEAGINGYTKEILENSDINLLAKR